MSHSTTAALARRRKAGAGLTMTLLILSALGLAAIGYVSFVLWPRWPKTITAADAPSLPITVGGEVFNVPPAAIRLAAERSPGAQPRLDLAFRWPDLAPPETASKPTLSDDLKPAFLFVTIAAPQGTLPLMERIRTIYPRYTMDSSFAGPAGLGGVSFRDGTPYQGEDMFFDIQQPQNFLARCTRPSGPMAGTCLLERNLGQAEVTVRFPRDWLGDWRNVSASTDSLLARLRTSHPQR